MPHRYFTRELADGRAALTGSDATIWPTSCAPESVRRSCSAGRTGWNTSHGHDHRAGAGGVFRHRRTTSKAEPDCAVTLFAGYPKAGKLEEVIRHSVELGVTEVVPFFSRYCVATPKKEDVKNERYNRIAAEAAKQAGRAMLPHVPCR